MNKEPFKKVILVTGTNGQLGRELREISINFPAFDFIFTSKEELSIGNHKALESFFNSHKIDYCLNCAAYTAVDKAESDSETAFAINAEAVQKLAFLCKEKKAAFIHISTDYVYSGENSQTPLKETHPTGPINIYGASKLKGEQLALEENENTLILRTSWVFSSYGSNFVKTMLRLFAEKESINVVSDQVGSPTYAADLAALMLLFIERMEKGECFSGIYNYSNAGVTDWYEFAQAIKEMVNSTCLVNPTTSASYITPATRPGYSVLDTSKVREALQLEIPNWKDSLRKCLSKLVPGE